MSSLDWSLIKETPDPKIIIIAGPTASGKSEISLEIAAKIGGEIINADSMQLYKDFPLLSAVPTKEEMKVMPHHLYGILEAHEQFSVAMWLEAVLKLLTTILERGKTPIIAGGTGLYIKALLQGLYALPAVSSENRQKAGDDWERLGVEKFHSMLATYDPASAEILHPNDKQRLIRSWEIFLETGKSIRSFQSKNTPLPLANFNVLKFLLFPDKDELKKRADLRFEKMILMGAVEEVQNLLNRGISLSAPVFRTLGATELAQYLSGEKNLEQACEKAKIATHQYIKRQRTWFRHQYPAPIVIF